MRSLLLTISFLAFAFTSIGGAKPKPKITIISVVPIAAYDIYNPADSAIRKLKITLALSGMPGKDLIFKLKVLPGGITSAPVLTNPVLKITKDDFKRGSLVTEITVKLMPVKCLLSPEVFVIGSDNAEYKKEGNTQDMVTITAIVPPNPSTIRLIEESTNVKPRLISDKNDQGIRNVEVTLLLSGNQASARDNILTFSFPEHLSPSVKPILISDVVTHLPTSSFSNDGCPVKVQVPVKIKLPVIDKPELLDKIPLLLSLDNKHAHWLNFKSEEIKTPAVTETTPATTEEKKENSFIYACRNDRNFIVTLKPDSAGGIVIVEEEKEKKSYQYLYTNDFDPVNFSQWMLNIFTYRIKSIPCNYCKPCEQELAEKVAGKLTSEKKSSTIATTAAQEKNTDKASTDEKNTDTKNPVKDEKAKPDTFNYHFNYPDSIFTLSITKENDITELKLCKGKEKGKGECIERSLVEATKENFDTALTAMLQKLAGQESIEKEKIKPDPGKIYDNYVKDVDSKKIKEQSEAQKKFDSRGAEIDSEKITYTDVGVISLRDSTGKINIYKADGSLLKEAKIETVQFTIEDGKLQRKQLYVKIGNETFLNKSAPIPVNRINERGGDNLGQLSISSDKLYILLSEVLEYKGTGYVPDDTTIILTPAKRAKTLSATSNLNSLINFSLYTDLTGLLGRRANGIINTDVSGKFITNTRNKPRDVDLTPLAFIEGNVVLSKFDSKFKSIDSSSIKLGKNGEKDTIDRMQLIQTAWFKGSAKLNLLSYHFFYYQNFYLNIGVRINVVNGDSLFRKERDIIFFDYYPELVYSINKLRNFGMDISLRWLQQRIADKEPFSNSGWESVFNPQIAFFYYPIANQNNKIYFRFNYFANRKKDANNFYQLQFGIKTDLKFGSKK